MLLQGRVTTTLLLFTVFSVLAFSVAEESVHHDVQKQMSATSGGKLSEMKEHAQSSEKSSKLDDSQEGPSFVQIWEIREYFARMFGLALIGGIVVIILVCCFTQPGCMVYDKFFDKGPTAQLDPDEEQAMMGDQERKA